jgi:hypothetical protein
MSEGGWGRELFKRIGTCSCGSSNPPVRLSLKVGDTYTVVTPALFEGQPFYDEVREYQTVQEHGKCCEFRMKGEKIVCFIDAPAVLGSGGMDDRRGNLEREVALIARSIEGLGQSDMGCGVHQPRDEIVGDVERVLSALIDADLRPEVCSVSVNRSSYTVGDWLTYT